ncbi:MAG TPA: hypothetical protein VGE98_06790 [Thermoanaerobaculia bacterium]
MPAELSTRSIVLDSNLLLLFLVGSLDRQLIGKHKRTEHFTIEDFDRLLTMLPPTPIKLVTTPNILTEVSNLAGQIEQTTKTKILSRLAMICEVLDERYLESKGASRQACFSELGLTDAVLVKLCSSGGVLLTADLDLFLEVTKAGGKAANFNHGRQQGWLRPASSSKHRKDRSSKRRRPKS